MPAPLAIAAYQGGAAVARYVATHGVKKAAEKYGKAALKKVATKKAAGSAAIRTALVSGEGAAVKAVNNRRAKANPGKKKVDENKANLVATAEQKTQESFHRAAKQKADEKRRKAAKKPAAKKPAAKKPAAKKPAAKKPAAKREPSISVKKNKTPLLTKIGRVRDKVYKPVNQRK